MDVFILWHIRHAKNLDGSPIEHRDDSGNVVIDEEYDNIKVIGVYSRGSAASSAIERARLREGFRDEPDCFVTSRFTLDEDHWTDGFVTIPEESN